MVNILIVDDDTQITILLSKIIKRQGHQCDVAHSKKNAVELNHSEKFDLILLDLELPDGNGLSILPDLLESASSPEVIIITGTGNLQGAELAFNYGAWDFIPKPINPEKVALSITRVLEYRKEKYLANRPKLLSREGIVGNSPNLKSCLELMAQAAATEANVLITGETGTGKELISRAIHKNSPRAESRFIVVDCASLPESLIESTLFGHEKGSFTGAGTSRTGMIKNAEHGTLFLDEVGELPASMQKTFLRVLQERSFRPVGGDVEIKSDFRLVAATNQDLEAMVNAGKFRSDLLYRLQSVTIHLPPLRERKKDIIPLVMHYLERHCVSKGFALKGCSPEFLGLLQTYDWPGNVRELFNTLDHTLAIAGDVPMLHLIHLPPHIRLPNLKDQLTDKIIKDQDDFESLLNEDGFPLLQNYRNAVIEQGEKKYLLELMRRTKGRIKLACEMSGLSKSRLYTLLKKYQTTRFR